jgi:RNA polymerase sigma factor (TIGR02999 family)
MLRDAQAGDPAAADALLPLVYEHLRGAARQRMANERSDHTLQATALVHEAYARLVGNDELAWESRGHFYVAAAEAMRRILIEHARARSRVKRGGSGPGPAFDRGTAIASVADLAAEKKPEEVIAFDEAFRRLQEQEPRIAEVVRLRFYAGLTIDQTAAVLGVSARTVDNDWAFARAWLFRVLCHEDDEHREDA